MTNTCPTTPYEEKKEIYTGKVSPFSPKASAFTPKAGIVGDKVDPYSTLQICAHLNQENGFAILDESHNYILI